MASFKIEGRLKRPEYVAAAVTACRQSLAGEVPDLETLRSVFSRSGFTDGYYTARRDLTMFGTRTREDAAASAEVLGKLSALTRNEVGRLPVDMVLTMAPGEPATLAVTDGTHRVEVAGEVPQTALTRPTDEEPGQPGPGKVRRYAILSAKPDLSYRGGADAAPFRPQSPARGRADCPGRSPQRGGALPAGPCRGRRAGR